jgi:hypothetical protein
MAQTDEDFSEFEDFADFEAMADEPAAAPAPAKASGWDAIPGATTWEKLKALGMRVNEQQAANFERKAQENQQSMGDFLLGMVRGGTFEAAPMISRWTSPPEYADEAQAVYDDAEQRSPWATGAGRMLGSLPAAMLLGPTAAPGASLASKLAFAAKSGAAGVGMGALTGFLGSKAGVGGSDPMAEFSPDNLEGKIDDAKAGAFFGGALGTAAPLIPEALMSAGKMVKEAPGRGWDALKVALGDKPAKVAAQAADSMPITTLADDLASEAGASAQAAPDNVIPIRGKEDEATKVNHLRRLLADEEGALKLGRPGSPAKAWSQIDSASGGIDPQHFSREAGHFDEIERLVGRQVADVEDAFRALVRHSAKARKNINWKDVQFAVQELRNVPGLKHIQMPTDAQQGIVEQVAKKAVGAEDAAPSWVTDDFAEMPSWSPDKIAKELQDDGAVFEAADTAITPVEFGKSAHEGLRPEQIHQGSKHAAELGLADDVPLDMQPGGPHIKNKGFYRGEQFKFPSDKPPFQPGKEALDISIDPEAAAVFASREKPTGSIDDLFLGDGSASEDEAIDLLMRGEMGRAKQRWALDVDSRVSAAPQRADAPAAVIDDVFDGPATGQGGADLYNPMGAPAAAREQAEQYADTAMMSRPDWWELQGRMGERPNNAPMTDDILAEVQRRAEAAGKPQMLDDLYGEPSFAGMAQDQKLLARGIPEQMPPDEIFASNSATKPAATEQNARGPITVTGITPDEPVARLPGARSTPRNSTRPVEEPFPQMQPETRRPMTHREPIDIPAAADQAAQKAQAVTPWDDEAIEAARQSGLGKLQNAGGLAGKVIGGASSIGGGLGGVVFGARAGSVGGKKAVNAVDWAMRKLSYDPAKLRAVANSNGPLAGAAKFILAGGEEAGEAGLKARAFVASMMPQLRELFADEAQAQ